MTKLALAIIAKNEVKEIERIVKDYGKYFDEIVVGYDSDIHELSHLPIKVYPYVWKKDFADKRNFVASKVESEYYLRLDCDDELINPQNIREIFDIAVKNGVDVVYVPYLYGFDEDGNCVAEHVRETIIKKSDNFYWMKPVHENIHIIDQSVFKPLKTDRFKIKHNLTDEHARESMLRNLEILLDEYNVDGENTDPRTIAYIGRAFIDLCDYRKAIPFLEKLIDKSGWDDDKYFAWIDIASANQHMGNIDSSIAACNEALGINTSFPDAYTKLAELYIYKKEWRKALDWQLLATTKKTPDTMYVINPSVYNIRPLVNLAIIYYNLGEFKRALEFIRKAKTLAPSNDFVKSNIALFEEMYQNDKVVKEIIGLALYLAIHDKNRLKHIVDIIPSKVKYDERICEVINRCAEPKVWGKDTVVFYCGQAWEDWADPSVLTGIGGSEEAVVYLSRELVKLGWKVTVYNSCGDLAGEYNGVVYKPFYEFNPKDRFNVVVAWRQNFFKKLDVSARRMLIWLHDVPTGMFGDKDELQTFNSLIVLSQFHKSLLPSFIPDSHIYVSSNGINTEDFKPSMLERNQKRIIYTSSYDRGIEYLLTAWNEIRSEVPDAELHIFYGWDTWIKMEEQGARPKQWRLAMQKLMQQPGVFEHGRIGHKQLVQELQKSAIYAYPSHFEEISCISAMKAQAAGCYCLTTDYAALKETNKYGTRVMGSAQSDTVRKVFVSELINLLKNGVDNTPHIEEFGWDKVAKKWSEELFLCKKLEFKDLNDYITQYSSANTNITTGFETGFYPRRFLNAVNVANDNNWIKKSLDIGSFDAFLPYLIAKNTDNRVMAHAIDVSDKGYCDINELTDKERGNVKLLTPNVFEDASIDGRFDLITCFEMLEHVIDVDVVLSKIKSLLTDNGIAMFTVPDKNGIYGDEHDVKFNASHIREYDADSFREALSKHFNVVECVAQDNLIYATCKKENS